MRDDFERHLESGLRLLADRAPTAPPDLMAQVRARRPRRWWKALAAFVTTGALVATGVAVTSPGGRPVEKPDPSPAIEKVFPRAVHSVPRLMPDGRMYDVVAMIDRGHALIRTGEGDRTDGLWSLDLATGRPTRLVEVSTPKGTVISFWSAAVGEGRIAWWTSRRVKGKMTTTFFTAPVTGGEQRVLAEAPGSPLDLTISDGRLVWTRGGTGGAYEVPLSGGVPKAIKGTEGMHMVQWPWVGTPAFRQQKLAIVHGEIVNALTGERRTTSGWTAPAQCSVTWCMSRDRIGRRDGTGARVVPEMFLADPPALDRFVLPRSPGGGLIDLATGRNIGLRADDNPVLDYRMKVLTYEKGGRLIIVDLAAIPRVNP
ncbi:hypothetical protein FDA94_35780 [Herbidospora galbida]|uniref:WD40 repeat domain-containing protein n=1 Tax=Herbidospora galbida TaxID=2575442 RepID=A0A4U3M0M8_9ACTN|nr:hypothetical protein [Herbidospora galbida]TKK80687.1 hypothetical protein FDA94_35780 [Herbidospora galbida]